MDYEKYLETIDISEINSSDDVFAYYGLILEFMSAHRTGIKDNKTDCKIKALSGRDVSEVLKIYDKELELNSIYNVYFNRCLNILDDDNYIDVYKLGMVTFHSYYNNIGYYNDKIQSMNLSRKSIFYNGKYSCDYKEFDKFHKERLSRIRVKKRW